MMVIDAGTLPRACSYLAAVLDTTFSLRVAVLTGVPRSLSSVGGVWAPAAPEIRVASARAKRSLVIDLQCAGGRRKIHAAVVFSARFGRLIDDETAMNESAQQKLAALRDRFAQSLPQRLDAIEQALHDHDPQLERLLHSLAGTAGTYGFAEISQLARAAEEDPARLPEILRQMRGEQAEACPHRVWEEASACPARILCLEDDPDQAAYVSTILESASYQVAVAHDIAEFERVVA